MFGPKMNCLSSVCKHEKKKNESVKRSKLSDASEKKLSPLYYATDNYDDQAFLHFPNLIGIDKHPKEKVIVDIQPLSLEVKILDLDGTDHYFKISRFTNQLDVSQSSYHTWKDDLYIDLKMSERGEWSNLMYFHPQIIKNYKTELRKFLLSISKFDYLQESDIIHDLWGLDKICASYGGDLIANIKKNGVDIPAYVITVDQILKIVKSIIRQSNEYAEYEKMMIFKYILYLSEKFKYENLHPEVFDEYSRHTHVVKKSAVDMTEVWNTTGNDLIKQENYQTAVNVFAEAINLDPQCPTFYLQRSIANFHLGEHEACLTDAAEAIALDPFNYKPYVYMAKCYLMKCCTEESIKLLGKAKLLEPIDKLVDDRLEESYGLRYDIEMYVNAVKLRDKKAKESHLQAMTKVILPSVACKKIAEFLCEKDLTAQAKVEIYELSKTHPCKGHIIFYYLAYIAFYEDNEEKFLEYSKLAKVKVSGHNHTKEYEHLDEIEKIFDIKKRGDELFESKKYKEAIDCYVEAVDSEHVVTPIISKCFYKISKAYFKLREITQAIQYVMRIIHLESNYCQEGDVKSLARVRDVLADFKEEDNIASGELQKNRKGSEQSGPKGSKANRKKSSLVESKSEMQKHLASNLRDKGNVQFERKCYREAIDTYSEAIELDPDNSNYYLNRATCHITLKNFEEALADSELALTLDPSLVKGLHRKCQCLIAFGKIDEAISAFEKANELKDDDKSLKSELNIAVDLKKKINQADCAYHSGKYKLAARLYEFIINSAEGCIGFRIKRIQSLINLNRYEDAQCVTRLAGVGVEGMYGLNYFVGICLFNNEDIGKTIEHFEQLANCHDEPNKKNSPLLKLLRKYKTAMHNASSSENRVEKLVTEIRQKLINGLRRVSGFKDANLYLENMVSVNSITSSENSDPPTLRNSLNIEKALCCITMKKYEAAMALAKEALKMDAQCLKALLIIGECNIILGNVEESISVFETAKGLGSSNDEVTKGLNKALKLRNSIKNAEKAVNEARYLKAYEQYKGASRVAHGNSSLLLNVAECCISLQNLSYLFKLVDSIQPEMRDTSEYYCIKALAEFHSFNGESECTELIQKAIDADPSNKKYQTYLNLFKSTFEKIAKGLESYQSKDYDRAVIYFKEGLFLGSNNIVINSEFNYYIGLIMMIQNKTLEAVDWFSEAAILKESFVDALDPKNLDKYITVLEKRALCFKKIEQFDDAISDYNKLFQRTASTTYKEMAEDIKKHDSCKTALGQMGLN